MLAALTMTLGNLAALRQENIKRMLAYSSIAHAGYMLVGVVARWASASASAQAGGAVLPGRYTFTTLGAFGVVAWIGNRKDERLFVDDWAGLARRAPAVALAMTIFLLSLGGVPPTGGFFAKFYLFRAAMESPQLYWLVVVGVLNSAISIYYYLRIVIAMYFRDAAAPAGADRFGVDARRPDHHRGRRRAAGGLPRLRSSSGPARPSAAPATAVTALLGK